MLPTLAAISMSIQYTISNDTFMAFLYMYVYSLPYQSWLELIPFQYLPSQDPGSHAHVSVPPLRSFWR